MRSISLLLIPLATMFVLVQSAQAAPENEPSKSKKRAAKKESSKKTQRGKASYYGPRFTGKTMASGEKFDPNSKSAASKTLPLGTKVEVTNLETGKKDVVVVEDRGPYVKGRIIDVTPKTAEKLDFKEEGVTPVKVKPIEVPKSGDKQSPSAASDRK
jgi:rare lipoprotein A